MDNKVSCKSCVYYEHVTNSGDPREWRYTTGWCKNIARANNKAWKIKTHQDVWCHLYDERGDVNMADDREAADMTDERETADMTDEPVKHAKRYDETRAAALQHMAVAYLALLNDYQGAVKEAEKKLVENVSDGTKLSFYRGQLLAMRAVIDHISICLEEVHARLEQLYKEAGEKSH